MDQHPPSNTAEVCNIPNQIDDDETIVRAVVFPYHFNKKHALKPGVLRSKAGIDEVSVIRTDYVGATFCKIKGKEIASNSPDAIYEGLLSMKKHHILSVGSEITDSRDEYCGHAHISHGIIAERDKPLAPEVSLKLEKKLAALFELCQFDPDPDPANSEWTGNPIGLLK